jgi:hypothetical protein
MRPTSAPTPPSLIQEVTAQITGEVSETSLTEAVAGDVLKTVAKDECGECTVMVESNFVVSLNYDFSVDCDKIPLDSAYEKSFAESLDVEASAVTVTSETTGCRRLLSYGERHLQSPSQTVSSKVTYGVAETTKAVEAANVDLANSQRR